MRADLKELNELDLHGAPYAYTPFCDSRKEMDGFRCDMYNKEKIIFLQCVSTYFPSFLFSFDMDRHEKVEKVLLTSIQGVHYAFAVQSTILLCKISLMTSYYLAVGHNHEQGFKNSKPTYTRYIFIAAQITK